MKLIKKFEHNNRTAKVYRDSDSKAFVVKFYLDGKHETAADYETDDQEDAFGTAKAQIEREAPTPKVKAKRKRCVRKPKVNPEVLAVEPEVVEEEYFDDEDEDEDNGGFAWKSEYWWYLGGAAALGYLLYRRQQGSPSTPSSVNGLGGMPEVGTPMNLDL